MKVMVMVKATPGSERGDLPSEQLIADMTAYNEQLVKAGIMKGGDGLKASKYGKRVRFGEAKKTVVDGPFAETKELIAGYWVWEVKSMDEALEWARRIPDPMPGEDSVIEIRPVMEMEDMGDTATPELKAQNERLRSEVASRR